MKQILFFILTTLVLTAPSYGDNGGCQGPPATDTNTYALAGGTKCTMTVNYFTCSMVLGARNFTVTLNHPKRTDVIITCTHRSGNIFQNLWDSKTGYNYDCTSKGKPKTSMKWGAYGQEQGICEYFNNK